VNLLFKKEKCPGGSSCRIYYLGMLLAAFVLPLGGCDKSSTQPASPPHKIVFAYTTQPQSTLVRIAIKKGYFSEEGLEIQPQLTTFGKAALEMVTDGRADFATVAETPVMFNIFKGEKIYVIANIVATNTNNAIVARRDAGISTAKDLKGRRIGFSPGTTSEFFMDSFLTANSIARSRIHAVPMKPEEMENAILSRKVDAVCTWNFGLSTIENKLGQNGISFYDKELYTETFNIAAKQEFTKNNPETVKQLLRALLKAESFVANHPDEAQAIVADDIKIAPELVRKVWPAFSYHLELNQMLLLTLEDEARWAMKNKLTEQAAMPNFLSYIYFDGLQAVKPEAVKIIH
jgi:ABC-type nitrate/sulfonate/bicarbonate transport system substrate-binding protein